MDKAKENRLRRWAERLGLTLRKSKVRNWNIDDHGGWMIINSQNTIESGEKFDLTIEDVEKFLKAEEKRLK